MDLKGPLRSLLLVWFRVWGLGFTVSKIQKNGASELKHEALQPRAPGFYMDTGLGFLLLAVYSVWRRFKLLAGRPERNCEPCT